MDQEGPTHRRPLPPRAAKVGESTRLTSQSVDETVTSSDGLSLCVNHLLGQTWSDGECQSGPQRIRWRKKPASLATHHPLSVPFPFIGDPEGLLPYAPQPLALLPHGCSGSGG